MPAERRSSHSPTTDEQLPAALRRFIRARGAGYLDDPNITSIGVGYKITGGDTTDILSLQFTVGQKVAPEHLESLGTTEIPESIDVGGFAVPTDVLERRYEPSFRVVAEARPPETKIRRDPVVPGISIANINETAGTLGCIVYDATEGTPLVLSNWHVLHGPDGAIGDVVVQPGPHDDNRTERNRLGVLTRSHLGVAGDCAVATIEDRRFDPAILGIGVTPAELGDPELGDTVIKSGRTTSVTHGVVRRVDVIVKMGYGAAGEHRIGCFEIGPDPARPAPDDEISRGGDSGAVWMFTAADGTPSIVLAGLHFGGDADSSPDEHALACLPQSVFEKLDITLSPRPAVQTTGGPAGYDVEFLGVAVDVPALDPGLVDDTFSLDGSITIDYTHFSLALSTSRRFARWVAWNIDGADIQKLGRKGIEFVLDPRIPAEFQVGDELYRDNRIDRGHLARRADLLWGPRPEAEQANKDSFSYTNIAPQMDDFNQRSRDGVWGRIEDAVFADADVDNLRVSMIAGPVFHDEDRIYRGVRIPREYFKIVVYLDHGELKSRAFLLTQNLDQLEGLELDEFRTFQVALPEIEKRTGLRFSDALHNAGTTADTESAGHRTPLDTEHDIRW
ncbi:DNA/RNA non-specific endonuclease [Nocardia cyriacigeorgica]|uniref:DNA/RNA non-specific endonuclease n=1 Tax=Nocardia cyriacigeorgica TaxID=135487 RepID=UPI002457AA24|nr:DNA/RNA non-specific endonuclease [Nocardia cyriacigeorgica]